MPLRTVIPVLGLLLVACGTGGDDPGAEPPVEESTSTLESTTTTIDPTTTSETQLADESELIQVATRDLAVRLQAPEEDIEVIDAGAVTWPDGSLGCPEPGKMYTQALVDGHRIVLSHADRVFLYHSGEGEPPFLCESEDKDGGYDFVPPPGDR